MPSVYLMPEVRIFEVLAALCDQVPSVVGGAELPLREELR
jgi:hypothetical protein